MPIGIDFQGQVVLVTGGATGLGRAIASAFGRAGASVALNDLGQDRVHGACERLSEQDVSCRPYAADVRNAEEMRRMVAAIENDLGPIDVAVANAGIYPVSSFLEMTEEEWDRVLDTNLKGAFLTGQTAARSMIKHGRAGCIITLSSGVANSAIFGWAHYSASKAGIIQLTKTMALELAPHGIRANAILPGYIDVDEGGAHLSMTYKQDARAAVPLRPGKPEDIANAVLMLASPLASFVTGTTLVVDGGSAAGRAGLRPVEN